jgi:hypothetical protein
MAVRFLAAVARRLTRARLRWAETDLEIMQRRAPALIADQRARVAALRAELGVRGAPDESEAIARRVELRAKLAGVLAPQR